MSSQFNNELPKVKDAFKLARFMKHKLTAKQFEFFVNQHYKTSSYCLIEYLTKQKHDMTIEDKESRILSVWLKSLLTEKELKVFVRFYNHVGLVSFSRYLEQMLKEENKK